MLEFGQWGRIDQQSLQRERQLAEQAITGAINQAAYEQQPFSIWDDAVAQTRKRNMVWMVENVGEWMNTYYGHDHAFVLDERDAPVYAMLGGTTRPAEDFSVLAYLVLPQVTELRAQLAEGTDPPQANVTRVRRIGDLPAIVSVVPSFRTPSA